MPTIGFIGLGNMGAPMAANLVKSGERVLGFDMVAAARQASVQAGVQIVADAKQSAALADVVVTMLPAGEHVVSVWRDVLPAAKKGALFIDCSTIDVASARAAHALAAEHGIASLDAPVSGGVGGAKAATLTFMVGGAAEAFARGKPVLERMGKRIVHCGEAGNGQVAKICNNMILGISMIGVSEAFVLGEKLGLSHQALFDVASASSGQCWSLTSYCPVPGPVPASPANNGYKPGFAAALMLKDLKLARAAAQSVKAKTALGTHAAEIYDLFAQQDQGTSDFSGIINFVRGQSGKS
ncbi:MAG: 3-hydroxyisobutyrate dehydrogenase [Xanthobacteraceae bacterium]